MAGLDAAIEAWREMEPRTGGQEFVFVDEIQSVKDWDVWVKLQVDFQKERRIFFTGSALPLVDAAQESGVGRWHICKLHTLFYEYLHIKKKFLFHLFQPFRLSFPFLVGSIGFSWMHSPS